MVKLLFNALDSIFVFVNDLLKLLLCDHFLVARSELFQLLIFDEKNILHVLWLLISSFNYLLVLYDLKTKLFKLLLVLPCGIFEQLG